MKVDPSSGKVKCPACGKLGIGYAPHPLAVGYKDYTKVLCRYCRQIFSLKENL